MALSALYIHMHVYHILSYVFIGLRRSSPTVFHTLFCHTRFNAPDQHLQLFLSQWHHTRIAFPVVSLHHRFCRMYFLRFPSISSLHVATSSPIESTYKTNGYIICNHDEDTVTGSSSAVHQLRRCRNRYNKLTAVPTARAFSLLGASPPSPLLACLQISQFWEADQT